MLSEGLKTRYTRNNDKMRVGRHQTFYFRVIQSLEEAEQARNDFLQLKEKAEFILSQLQVPLVFLLYLNCMPNPRERPPATLEVKCKFLASSNCTNRLPLHPE